MRWRGIVASVAAISVVAAIVLLTRNAAVQPSHEGTAHTQQATQPATSEPVSTVTQPPAAKPFDVNNIENPILRYQAQQMTEEGKAELALRMQMGEYQGYCQNGVPVVTYTPPVTRTRTAEVRPVCVGKVFSNEKIALEYTGIDHLGNQYHYQLEGDQYKLVDVREGGSHN